ncbi:MAG: hypothetical protein NVSMB64_26570 [Candidatus Velthaea sp.]
MEVTPLIECRAMAGPERYDAFALMKRFRTDEAALGDALALFVDREDYGFVWLAYREAVPVGCASVGYAIATDAGGVVALVRDMYVVTDARRSGIATALLASLHARLDALDVERVDIPVAGDPGLQAFLLKSGYAPTDELTFSLGR